MNKKISLVLIVAAAAFGLSWMFAAKWPTVKFVPLRMEEGFRNRLVEAPELMTDEFSRSISEVLNHYGERYSVKNGGEIYITYNLHRDKEMVWNYSIKAADKEFMKGIRRADQ